MTQEKAIGIHEKILAISRFNPYLKRVNLSSPQFVFTFGKNPSELDLNYIAYRDYDEIFVTDTGIEYHPEIGTMVEIIEYHGWNELLNL